MQDRDTQTIRPRRRRAALGLALATLAIAAALAWLSLRPAPQPAAPARAPTLDPVAAELELSDADLVPVQRVELTRSLDISGATKAVRSAFVKARVAAEVLRVSAREGNAVRAGQVLVQLDATEFDWRLRQAEETAQTARAQLDIARRTLDNNRALVAQGFISPTALETSIANEAAARSSLQAAEAGAQIARKARADTVLAAPFAGVVSQRLVQPGERVAVDARLLEIVDLSNIELETALAAEDVGQLRIGAPALLQVDGVAQEVQARVARINPSTQVGTRAIMVYLALAPHPALRQGLFAHGRIELDRQSVLAVPASAVRLDQARPYVLAIESGRVVRRHVTPGLTGYVAARPMRAIGDTLPEGTRVLAGTLGPVREGASVRVTPAAPQPAAR